MTEWALRFIRESQAQPFFLYAAYTIPHYANRSEDRSQFPVVSDTPYGNRDWTQAEKNYAAMITLLDTDPIGKMYQGKPIWRPTWSYD
jgi:arylsulfatase A-like enzyme